MRAPPVVAVIGLFCFYQVDEEMRQELAEWKLAVDKDKGGKAKGNAKVRSYTQIMHCICHGGLVTVDINYLELCLDIYFTSQKKKASKSGKKKKKEKDLTSDRRGHTEEHVKSMIFSTEFSCLKLIN